VIIRELDRQKLGAAILWKYIQRAVDPHKMPALKDLIPKVYSEYQFEDENEARQYLFYQSQELLKFMQERRNRKLWGGSQLFRELVECSLPARASERMSRVTLRTRDYALNVIKVEYHTSSDEEPPDGERQPVPSLRPRSGKGSARKSKSYRGREAPVKDEDGDERMSSSEAASTPRKRKLGEAERGPDAARRRLRPREAEGETASEQRESSAEPERGGAAMTELALRWRRDADGAGAAAVVEDGALQVEANAPGDVWRCTVIGCVHAVYGASGRLGQRLIEEHVEEHRSDDDAPQVNLAVREMQKCQLPVRYVCSIRAWECLTLRSNLIKRIREFAAAKDLATTSAEAEEGGSPSYPAAIRRLVSQ
jgi:hypothetical protein